MKFYDWLARWVVTFGGAVVIVCVLAILVLIVATALPLFYPADARLLAEAELPEAIKPEGVSALGIQAAADDSWLVAQVVDGTGKFRFVDLRRNEVVKVADGGPPESPYGPRKPRQPPRTLLGAAPSGPSDFTLCWSDGVVSLVHTAAKMEDGGKILEFPKLSVETVAAHFPQTPEDAPDKLGVPEKAVMYRTSEDSFRCAAIYHGRKIVVTRQTEDLTGDKSETKIVLEPETPGPVTAIAMSSDGKWLYAGTVPADRCCGGSWTTAAGSIATSCRRRRRKRALHRYRLMFGDITLVAGDAEGNVTNWFFVKSPIENVTSEQPKQPGGGRQGMVKESKKLTFIRELAPHRAAIDDIVPSPRNRGVLIGDRDNDTSLDYTTSQRRLLSLSGVTRGIQ